MPNTKPIGVAYSDPQFDTVDASNYIASNQFINNTLNGPVVQNITAGLYFLSSAVTANVTTTSAPKGSIATTVNATGAGKLFVSDGAKWQFAVVA
jgi:hypothetical protein